ncbi:MAG: molybdenum cofactor biosynthesis protein MoaE [Robiginitomaculum sp.]|nr:molybdenum cofactor biosynthesis protein MoaE [Robiginitomaculum sp.]
MLEIMDTPFNPGERLNAFSEKCKDAGAIASFIGLVRGQKGEVSELRLESYPGVTEQGIEQAIEQAKKRWPLTTALVIHRIGSMGVGEPIVLVATASKHRRAAFESCDFLMDYLKTDAVFWKHQIGPDGAKWIEPREQDYQDKNRWS